MALSTAQQVQQLYIGYLGRAADRGGLEYWVNGIETGAITLEGVRTNFVNFQPEYAEEYAGLDRAATLTKIYQNLFERTFDQSGYDYWLNGEGSAVPEDNLIAAFLAAAGPGDRTILDSKLRVAEGYTAVAGRDHYDKSGGTAIIADVSDAATEQAATNLLNTVNLFLQSDQSSSSAKVLGVTQSQPGVAEVVEVGGRAGLPDVLMLNTDNFDPSGDVIRLTNLEPNDQFFFGESYLNRKASPSTGDNSQLEIFLEQTGDDVRMSVETSLAGANAVGEDQLVTIVITGATVDEILPVPL